MNVSAKKIVDTALFFAMCALAGTGLAMEFRGAHGAGDLHFAIAVVVLLLAALHVFLSKPWIVNVLSKGSGKAAVGILCAGLALGAALFFFAPQKEHERHRHGAGAGHGPHAEQAGEHESDD